MGETYKNFLYWKSVPDYSRWDDIRISHLIAKCWRDTFIHKSLKWIGFDEWAVKTEMVEGCTVSLYCGENDNESYVSLYIHEIRYEIRYKIFPGSHDWKLMYDVVNYVCGNVKETFSSFIEELAEDNEFILMSWYMKLWHRIKYQIKNFFG